MRAAKKAGHVGRSFGHSRTHARRSRFGRGRRTALLLALHSSARRVVVQARVVRHHGTHARVAPLHKHVAYLKREGVTRDDTEARMLDASSDDAHERDFAERCAGDRHHFRFVISPENAVDLADLRSFTRELMKDVERDLDTGLDWIAVDHWNTDNPHVHILIRGRADDDQDLVISRQYISQGFRQRAAERLTLELGRRSEHEIRSALQQEVEAERWTSLDRELRNIADEGAGMADLRPNASDDRELRGLLLGRAAKLERLGLAEKVGPASWTLKHSIEETLRELAIRGDVIKTMHRAMSGLGREADVAGFALHGDEPAEPVLGRLIARGLCDELNWAAYAIVEGVDGRTHHVRFADLDMTGDAKLGAIVEVRVYDDEHGRRRLSLATRSDLTIEEQVTARGATWLDRQLVSRKPIASSGAFGTEVRAAMERRVDFLVEERLARRQGQHVMFVRDLIERLGQRERDEAIAKLSSETGLPHQPSGEGHHVRGVFRQRVTLASGRFAMIDDGLGFQLVPWRPALERQLGKEVTGVVTPGGGVDWSFRRQRGLVL